MKMFQEQRMRMLIVATLLALLLFAPLCQTLAQDKISVQVKTFTQQLDPYRNVEVSINGKPYISLGAKGSAMTDLTSADFPIRSVTIKDQKLEAASWLFSKGVVEIIIRNKSYEIVPVLLRTTANVPVGRTKIVFNGKKRFESTTDNDGRISLPLAIDERITSSNQFNIPGFDITNMTNDNGQTTLIVQPVVVPVAESTPQQQAPPATSRKEYFKDFKLSMLDSIQSLTMFYAIFKDYEINDLSPDAKRRVDAKFNELVRALEDSVQQSERSFIGRINDSTLVREDIANLIHQARLESETLTNQWQAFDEKIKIITRKLDAGVSDMDDNTRKELLAELSLLERLLIENESRFFKNHSDYMSIINTIREKYFNLTALEDKLSESEAQRLEEQRIFRQRLLAISALVLLFGGLTLLLIIARRKLKKQTVELAKANTEVKRINETLEQLVHQRTRSLAEAHKELDTFLYRASHDMRSPVRSIIGLCNIAGIMVDGEPKELINRVVNTTMGMDKLLKKLSIISEINEPTDFSPINLRETIEEVHRDISATMKSNTQFNLTCPSDITIYSFRNLIQTILHNVIENGLVFAALDNTRLPQVHINVQRDGDGVSVTIEDNGLGFDVFVKERLFDMFFKGTEKSAGHGLGLYIVSKAITALSGTIQVESSPGSFTRFTLWLPVNAGKVDTSLVERKAVA